jgi:transcriptional regulator GlxA family with amidase domain
MGDFEVIVVPGASPSSVALARDLLKAAATAAAQAGQAAPRWDLRSLEGGSIELQGGFSVRTRRLPSAAPGSCTWVIPGLGITDAGELPQRLLDADLVTLARRVARHVARGGQVAACGSAVFVLQRAGVLAGRTVTTSWWLAPTLAQWAPDCRITPDRLVVADGPVVTAGGSIAHADLMLFLLRRRLGPALVDAVSSMLLLDGRHAQAGFVIPAVLSSGDELVSRLAAKVAAALPQSPSIAELAREFRVSERTLARHVRSATGRSPHQLVQSVKLFRARTLLENSRLSIEEIAAAVGYQDSTALRRMMRKTVGVSPSHFRPAVDSRRA